MRKRRRRRQSSRSPKVGNLADIENSRKLKTLGATGGKSRGAAGSMRKLETVKISGLRDIPKSRRR